ncbi:MAG: heavy metal transport/detoxification protein [Xenococcaceae cyanobacterium]
MLEFHIPTLNGKEAAKELKDTIITSEPNAKVEIDSDAKKISIESQASEETFKQLIVAAGHKIER